MKAQLFSIIYLFMLFSEQVNAQIVINEVNAAQDRVEIKNLGNSTVNVSSYFLCTFPVYNTLGSLIIESGSTSLAPGALLVVSGHTLGNANGELGLYLNSQFTNPASIIDYMEYGNAGHTRATVAISAGIWSPANFVVTPPANESMMYDGDGNLASDWFSGLATFGQQNPCQFLEGDFDNDGIVSTSDFLLFFTEYGCQSECAPYDLTGDGIVNTNDLLDLVALFGSVC